MEAAIYMNDRLNTTSTSANPHPKSPYEMFYGRLPPANTLAFMQPGFRRTHPTHKSEPKAETCSYLIRGRIHPWDCVKVVTLSGQTSDTPDVTWEAELTPTIPLPSPRTSDTGAHTRPDTRDDDFRISYLSPVMTPLPPVTPVLPSPPVMTPVMTPVPPVTSVLPSSPVITPVVRPAPPMVPPPTGVMSPPSLPETENPQVDEGLSDNQLLQPGRTRSRTRAYHRASTSAPSAEWGVSADHALCHQPPPNEPAPFLSPFDASELEEPATYLEAMQSPNSANWSHAMEREASGLKEAGTFGDV